MIDLSQWNCRGEGETFLSIWASQFSENSFAIFKIALQFSENFSEVLIRTLQVLKKPSILAAGFPQNKFQCSVIYRREICWSTYRTLSTVKSGCRVWEKNSLSTDIFRLSLAMSTMAVTKFDPWNEYSNKVYKYLFEFIDSLVWLLCGRCSFFMHLWSQTPTIWFGNSRSQKVSPL